MKTIYYVTEKQTQDIDVNASIEELTGWKQIRGYQLLDSKLALLFEIEAKNEDSDEDEIFFWLENNGYDEDYNLVCL